MNNNRTHNPRKDRPFESRKCKDIECRLWRNRFPNGEIGFRSDTVQNLPNGSSTHSIPAKRLLAAAWVNFKMFHYVRRQMFLYGEIRGSKKQRLE